MTFGKRVLTPTSVMWLALLMYVVKVAGKLFVGYLVAQPAIYGDGAHNISDILEASLVLVALRIAGHAASDVYPFGKRNVESIFTLGQGLALLAIAVQVAYESVEPLYQLLTARTTVPLPTGTWSQETAALVLGLFVASISLSCLVGMAQIHTGRRHNRPLVVADGRETLSDGCVEAGILVGMLGIVLLGQSWPGAVAGLVVACLLVRTGSSLAWEGLTTLLQKSIGAEHHRHIVEDLLATPGVKEVPECQSFKVGGLVVIILKVVTSKPNLDGLAARDLKWAVAIRIERYLRAFGMHESKQFIRFDPGDPCDHRVAYILGGSGMNALIAGTFEEATHVRLCDVRHGRVVRIKDVPIADTLYETLANKHVHVIYGWQAPEDVPQDVREMYRMTHSPVPPQTIE